MEQIKFPNFIELPAYFNIKKGEEVYVKSKIKINPMQVVYFYPINVNVGDGVEVQVTSLTVGNGIFWVAMSYDEFDELWDDVKRTFDVNEPLFLNNKNRK